MSKLRFGVQSFGCWLQGIGLEGTWLKVSISLKLITKLLGKPHAKDRGCSAEFMLDCV